MKRVMIGAGLVCLSAVQWAPAVMIEFSGTPGTNVSMSFVQDVNFTVTRDVSKSSLYFVIDNLFATPDSAATSTTGYSPYLEFSINGGSRMPMDVWADNVRMEFGDLTPTDSYFGLIVQGDKFSVTTGDAITLHAGAFLTVAPSGFNLGSSGNYDMFMMDETAIRCADAVPEPATALLFGIGIMGAWMLRRNKVKSDEEADA